MLKFDQLLSSFESYSLLPNSPNKLSNIIAIETSCSINSALKIAQLCPNLKRLSSVYLTRSSHKESYEKLDLLLESSAIEHIGIDLFDKIYEQTLSPKINELQVELPKQHFIKQINCQLPYLTKLSLSGDEEEGVNQTIEVSFISLLGNFNHLKELSFDYYAISNEALQAISKLYQLERLSLERCTYDEYYCEITLPSNLKEILFEIHSKSMYFAFKFLPAAYYKDITISLQLYLHDFQNEDITKLEDMLSYYYFSFKSIRLSRICPDEILQVLKKRSGCLQQFLWYYVTQTNSKALTSFLADQKHLKHLKLINCRDLDNKDLILISRIKSLRKLVLDRCCLRDRGVIYVKKMKGLEVLDLEKNTVGRLVSTQIMCNLKLAWKVLNGNPEPHEGKKARENKYQMRYFDS